MKFLKNKKFAVSPLETAGVGFFLIKKALFVLEATLIPLFSGRSCKPMPLVKVATLTLIALIVSICLSMIPFLTSPEVVSDSEAVESQLEFVAETTSLPITRPLDEPVSSSLVFSIIFGCLAYILLLLQENLFIIFPLLVPFSFFERRFFGFDLLLPAVVAVGLFFAVLHSSWGFSAFGLAKLLPFSFLLAYLTYEHGVIRASFSHIVYNFSIIGFSIAGVF